MAMKVSTRSSDAASAGRAVPWPVLEAGNGSFVEGIYTVSLKPRVPGRSFSLIHEVENAGLIANWIRTGRAKFVCTVAAPVSAYRKVHVSDAAQQVIEWHPDDLGSHPLFTPMIVTTSDVRHTVDAARDEVHPLWHGKVLRLQKGSRVAICSTFALKSGLLGLLKFRLDGDFEPGRFKVVPSNEEGFTFTVHLAKDLFDHLSHSRQELAGRNIMTHIVSAALSHLRRDYTSDDGEEGWKSYQNLVAFADLLDSKQLGHWSDDDFDPAFVATSLYPHQVPVVEIGE